ncbi:MAG: hypothetical protein UU06_C0040G0005 [Parcubacteria group bacterium GW2011_GWB1_40_5]|nr:MAG: hypothetical protein UU06_C0040G0005 [Parcubacteria group bacterium GW2011_GWB1_40_5]
MKNNIKHMNSVFSKFFIISVVLLIGIVYLNPTHVYGLGVCAPDFPGSVGTPRITVDINGTSYSENNSVTVQSGSKVSFVVHTYAEPSSVNTVSYPGGSNMYYAPNSGGRSYTTETMNSNGTIYVSVEQNCDEEWDDASGHHGPFPAPFKEISINLNVSSPSVNGSCSPTHYNCSAGNRGNTEERSDEYRWWCNGTNGGTNKLCTETKTSTPPPTNPTKINGSCSPTHYNCSLGTLGPTAEYPDQYQWWCNGTNGGTNKLCSESKSTSPVNGSCSPTHYNCSLGTLGPTAEYSNQYQWWCNGKNGGTNRLCVEMKSAPINASCSPTHYNCILGNLGATEERSDEYRWWCNSPNGGSNVLCSEVKTSKICSINSFTADNSNPNLGTGTTLRFSLSGSNTTWSLALLAGTTQPSSSSGVNSGTVTTGNLNAVHIYRLTCDNTTRDLTVIPKNLPPQTCQNPSASNYGGPLPCVFVPPGGVSVDVLIKKSIESDSQYRSSLSLASSETNANYTDSDPVTGPTTPGTYYYGVRCTGTSGGVAEDSVTVVMSSLPNETCRDINADNYGGPTPCTYNQQVNGSCGDRNTTYVFGTEDYPAESKFCSLGTLRTNSGLVPVFPQPGESTSWFCDGINGGGNAGPCTTRLDVQTFRITAEHSTGGTVKSTTDSNINCGDNCSHNYGVGSSVTLQALPGSTYWKLGGWITSPPSICMGDGLCVISNIDKNVTARAVFVLRAFNYIEF